MVQTIATLERKTLGGRKRKSKRQKTKESGAGSSSTAGMCETATARCSGLSGDARSLKNCWTT